MKVKPHGANSAASLKDKASGGYVLNNNNKTLCVLAMLPFAVIVVFFEVLPIAMTIFRSFISEGGGGLTIDNYTAIFTKKLYRDAVINSMIVAVASSLAGLFISFWGAKGYNSASVKVRNIFLSILNMTSNFSGIPLAFAYIILLGNVGVLMVFAKNHGIDFISSFSIYSIGGLMLCYVYFQVPLATLLLIPSFEGLKKEWRESVNLLGGGDATYWIKVGLPNLLPGIMGTFSVLFANAIAAFATGYALMQNNFSLLPIRISEQFVGDISQRREFGSALAVALMLMMVAAIYVNNKIAKRSSGGV